MTNVLIKNIVVPRYIDFVTWADTLQTDLPNLNIPLAESENTWKEWAELTLSENDLVNVPLPEDFSDWRNWADYFLNNV